jgi:hypothetical protein
MASTSSHTSNAILSWYFYRSITTIDTGTLSMLIVA